MAAMQRKEIKWSEFRCRYREELWAESEVDEDNDTIKDHGRKFSPRLLKHLAEHENVALLCHCAEDAAHCHRHILKEFIESAKV